MTFYALCHRNRHAFRQEAVERAKQDVLECDGNIFERNELVQRLIRLRIQEYVMMERAAGPLPDFEKRGHSLINWNEGKGNFPGVINAKRIYCQVRDPFSQLVLYLIIDLQPTNISIGLRLEDLGLPAIYCAVLLRLRIRCSW